MWYKKEMQHLRTKKTVLAEISLLPGSLNLKQLGRLLV